jgi:anti-sigma factor RsiW
MSDHKHNPKQCMALFARLSEYLNNELDPESRQSIDEHLKDCRPCQVCLSTLHRTVELCRQFRSAPLPTEFSNRLRSFLQRMSSGI